MNRIAALLVPSVLGLAAPHRGGQSARAAEAVPEVAATDRPVAGTCAPLDAADVTRVLVGPGGSYRVDGQAQVIDDAGLTALLAQRAHVAPGGTSRHSVWATMSATQVFKPFYALRTACYKAGIFRLGLEVKSESGATGLGFPLFLPGKPVAPAPDAPKGRRIELLLDRWEQSGSHPRRLYAMAQSASKSYAPIVTEVSLDVNLSVQHVVTCLDLLYRGGSAGVTVKFRDPVRARASKVTESNDPKNRAGGADTSVPLHLLATVVRESGNVMLPATEPNLEVAPVAPRTEPWGDDGANQPGALALALEDIPEEKGAGKPKAEPSKEPLPSYAGRREGAPTTAVVAADRAVAGWTGLLGRVLTLGLNLKWDPEARGRFVTRLRDVKRMGDTIEPLAKMFPGTQKVTPSTLLFDVYLVRGVNFVGKVEVTLHVAGSAVSIVYAKWVVEQVPADITLAPPATDPFAAGVPGHLRVWLEAAFDTVYRQGAVGFPLAPVNEVLEQLPEVAKKSTSADLAARAANLELLAKWLQVTDYDRLVLVCRGGIASVRAENRVAGILQFALESEEADLRLTGLSGRVAPK